MDYSVVIKMIDRAIADIEERQEAETEPYYHALDLLNELDSEPAAHDEAGHCMTCLWCKISEDIDGPECTNPNLKRSDETDGELLCMNLQYGAKCLCYQQLTARNVAGVCPSCAKSICVDGSRHG